MELFGNNAATTLNGGISSSATSLVVQSASNFPTTGSFRILVDSGANLEYMLVTSVSGGTTFNVTRGIEGTTGVAHSGGVQVVQIVTAGSVAQTIADNRSGIHYGVPYSAVEVIYSSGAPHNNTFNGTFGSQFYVTTPATVVGVYAYWANTASQTLKASLWDIAGATRLATGNLALSAAGFYYIPFASPYTIGASELQKSLGATIWETSGTNYTLGSQSLIPNYFSPSINSARVWGGPFLTWQSWNVWNNGDANPTQVATGETYPVEPVFQIPNTTTTANYTQPSYGSTVSVSVSSSTGMLLGQVLYITTGGFYKIGAIVGTTLTLLNLADSTTGAAGGTTILAGALVQLQ